MKKEYDFSNGVRGLPLKPFNLRIRFRHLTDYQRQMICNGCGPKGGVFCDPKEEVGNLVVYRIISPSGKVYDGIQEKKQSLLS